MTCQKCDGTGIKLVPNGEDDIDKEYCECEAGQKLEKDDKFEKMADISLDTLI